MYGGHQFSIGIERQFQFFRIFPSDGFHIISQCLAKSSKATSMESPCKPSSERTTLLQRILAIIILSKVSFPFTKSNVPNFFGIHLSGNVGKNYCWTFILSSVNVPVLSVQMILVAPKVCTASSFLMITCFFDNRNMPCAKAMVATMGKPSGMAATAKATPVSIIKSKSFPRI